MNKPTDYLNTLDRIHLWIHSEDDSLVEDLHLEEMAHLIRKLGSERDEALALVRRRENEVARKDARVRRLEDDLLKEGLPPGRYWSIADKRRREADRSLNTLTNAAQCNMADVERLTDDEAKEVLVNLCRMTLKEDPPMNKPTPPNHGRSWTDRENHKLAQQFDHGSRLGYMIAVHGRKPGAILGQLVRIGKLVQTEDGRYYRADALWHDYRKESQDGQR